MRSHINSNLEIAFSANFIWTINSISKFKFWCKRCNINCWKGSKTKFLFRFGCALKVTCKGFRSRIVSIKYLQFGECRERRSLLQTIRITCIMAKQSREYRICKVCESPWLSVVVKLGKRKTILLVFLFNLFTWVFRIIGFKINLGD